MGVAGSSTTFLPWNFPSVLSEASPPAWLLCALLPFLPSPLLPPPLPLPPFLPLLLPLLFIAYYYILEYEYHFIISRSPYRIRSQSSIFTFVSKGLLQGFLLFPGASVLSLCLTLQGEKVHVFGLSRSWKMSEVLPFP